MGAKGTGAPGRKRTTVWMPIGLLQALDQRAAALEMNRTRFLEHIIRKELGRRIGRGGSARSEGGSDGIFG